MVGRPPPLAPQPGYGRAAAHSYADDREHLRPREHELRERVAYCRMAQAGKTGRPAPEMEEEWGRPGKGWLRSRFRQSAQLGLSHNDFSGPRNRHRHRSQRNASGWAGWKRLGPVVTMRSRSRGRRASECWLGAASVIRRLSPNRSEPTKRSRKIVPGQR